MKSLVQPQFIRSSKTLPTLGAVVWAFPCMSSLVSPQRTQNE
uniref:Uncharacterized protein n=1 Tax=Anguilla anguilla TaxID=7936 RepID=A0A0E9TS07_ANGAN